MTQRPRSDDTVHPVVTGEINYTFGNGWQAFFGTSLEDAVTLDGVTQLGARKDLGSAGILQGGFLFSGIPTQVWEDPYAEGVRRKETDRDSTGLRLQWDRVLGTALELTFSYRDIAIDTERSGEGVTSVDLRCGLPGTAAARRRPVSSSMRPTCSGSARAGVTSCGRWSATRSTTARATRSAATRYRLQLSYVFLGQGYTVASNVAYGSSSQDARNPIFGRKTDSDGVVLDTTVFYRLPIDGGRWQAVGSVLWGEDDSDVDFHDAEVTSVSLGLMYRFGAR